MLGPRFKIDPDPPVAGLPATVTYHGDENEVTWAVTGGQATAKSVPPRSFRIDPVPSGERLMITDDTGGEESSADWPIVEQDHEKR